MATLQYRDKNGEIHKINPWQVHNVVLCNSTGDSTIDTMSQKAISECIEGLDDKIFNHEKEVTEKFTHYYTSEEIDNKSNETSENVTKEIEDAISVESQRAIDVENEIKSSFESFKSDATDKLNELYNKSNDLDNNLSNLETKHDKDKEELNDLISNLDTALSNLESKHDTEKSDIDSVIENLTITVNDNKSELDTTIDNLTKIVNDNKTNTDDSISTLETKHDKDKEELNELIANLDTALSNLESKHNTEKNELDEVIVDLTTTVNDNKSESDTTIENLTKVVNDNKTELDNTIYTLETKHDNEITHLNGEIVRIESKHNLEVATETNRAKTEEEVIRESLKSLVNGVNYDKENRIIKFLHGENILATIETDDFIKDGMVNNVELRSGNLVIEFNTDSKTEPIFIPLTEIFNPENYYTKKEIDRTIDEINAKISVYEMDDIYFKGQISIMSDKIEVVRDEISHLKADFVVVQSDKDKLQIQVNDIRKDLDFATENISHLEDDVESINLNLRDKIDKLDVKCDEYKAELDGVIETIISDKQSSDMAFEQYKTAMEATITEMNDKIKELSDKIAWYEYNS